MMWVYMYMYIFVCYNIEKYVFNVIFFIFFYRCGSPLSVKYDLDMDPMAVLWLTAIFIITHLECQMMEISFFKR